MTIPPLSMHGLEDLIELALKEDIGLGDITTDALVAPDLLGRGRIVAKETLILAGMAVACRVFHRLDPAITVTASRSDGERLIPGDTVAVFEGSLRALLMGERTALNFLQRASGVATHTRQYVEHLDHPVIRLTDTRKTTPGLRILEKYAVRVGGAHNHRMGLFDGVLIKDNHIAVSGGVRTAVETVRQHISHLVKIEVEVTTLDEVREALAAGADVIMLDNMTRDQVVEAMGVIGSQAVVEVSGGIDRERARDLATLGVHIISVGALTHGARAVDLSMRIEPA